MDFRPLLVHVPSRYIQENRRCGSETGSGQTSLRRKQDTISKSSFARIPSETPCTSASPSHCKRDSVPRQGVFPQILLSHDRTESKKVTAPCNNHLRTHSFSLKAFAIHCKNCCITSIYRTNDGKSIEICPVDNEIIKVSKR